MGLYIGSQFPRGERTGRIDGGDALRRQIGCADKGHAAGLPGQLSGIVVVHIQTFQVVLRQLQLPFQAAQMLFADLAEGPGLIGKAVADILQ